MDRNDVEVPYIITGMFAPARVTCTSLSYAAVLVSAPKHEILPDQKAGDMTMAQLQTQNKPQRRDGTLPDAVLDLGGSAQERGELHVPACGVVHARAGFG